MTLHDLALGYITSQVSLVYEFCGNPEDRFKELLKVLEEEINPLLVKYGETPVPLDAVPYRFWFGED